MSNTNNKSRNKRLTINVAIFTISNFSSKLLTFLLLPFYTSVLTTEQYGTADIVTTTSSFIIPIITLCVSEAVLRFSMSKEHDSRAVFSFGMKILLIGFSFLAIVSPVVQHYTPIGENAALLVLIVITSSLSNFMTMFAKGLDKILIVGIGGIASTIGMIATNIILLSILNYGTKGYLISFVVSYMASLIVIFFGAKLYRYVSFKKIDKALALGMLAYCLPFIPNTVSWWLIDSFNKLMLKAKITISGVDGVNGETAVALYAVANRIPSILTTIQGFFTSAWVLSAISEYDSKDKDEYYQQNYRMFSSSMVLVCSGLIICNRLIARILFQADYFEAWHFAPFLLVSALFGGLDGFQGALFNASKKTSVLFTSTLFGGIVAVAMNLTLMPFVGIQAATISNMVAYIVIWLIRDFYLRKNSIMSFKIKRDVVLYFLLIVEATISVYVKPIWVSYAIASVVFVLICGLERYTIFSIFTLVKNTIIKIFNKMSNKLK